MMRTPARIELGIVIPSIKTGIGELEEVLNESSIPQFDKACGVISDCIWAFQTIRSELTGKSIQQIQQLVEDLQDAITGGMELRNELNAIIQQYNISTISAGHRIP